MLTTFSSRDEVVPVTFTPSRRESLNFGPVYLAMLVPTVETGSTNATAPCYAGRTSGNSAPRCHRSFDATRPDVERHGSRCGISRRRPVWKHPRTDAHIPHRN